MKFAIAVTTLACAMPSSALAFDTGPHADMTRDALTAEGFGRAASDVAMVNSWFTDYYFNADKTPWSGHSGNTRVIAILSGEFQKWPDEWVDGAQRMHFDAERQGSEMPDLGYTHGIDREWRRLAYLTKQRLQQASNEDDPLLVLTAVGVSLHAVQDFYTHSNWVEDEHAEFGRGGPGLAARGWGATPTWFDIREGLRNELTIYTGVSGIPRGHGDWNSDENHSLHGGLNKDWPGRPKFQQAYVAAYFASRQWVRGMREWLGNDQLWKRAMATRSTGELAHDVTAATQISTHTGHWQGGGEPCLPGHCGDTVGPAGSGTNTLAALRTFHGIGPTRYRKRFNNTIASWNADPADPPQVTLPSTRALQEATRFVQLEVVDYSAKDMTDPESGADVFVRARVNGQSFASTVINGEDNFNFPGAHAPFTWLKAVRKPHEASMPVTRMTVRIETGDRSKAGTNDNVYLRINGNQRFQLDKRAYDDFERGDDDWYSVPIGDATRNGLTVADIDRAVIEKSEDGNYGGWFLKGVTLNVNGREIVHERGINRWLEDSRRTWTAPRLPRDHRTSDVVPVWLEMRDDDNHFDDLGDINVYDRHTSLPLAYRLGSLIGDSVTGDDRYSGRLPLDDGDDARLRYRLTTVSFEPPPKYLPERFPTPDAVIEPIEDPPAPSEPAPPNEDPAPPTDEPPPPPPPGDEPPPPPPAKRPDLIITDLSPRTVTVKNQGTAATRPFNVSVEPWGTVRFSGLQPGYSKTLNYYSGSGCGGDYRAFVDSAQEISESNEDNNRLEYYGVVC